MKSLVKVGGVPVAAFAALLATTAQGAVATAASAAEPGGVDADAQAGGTLRWQEDASAATKSWSESEVYYTFPVRQLARPVNRVSAVGSAGTVEVRGQRPDGRWTEWRPVTGNKPVVAPYSGTKIQVRVVIDNPAAATVAVPAVTLTADTAPASTATSGSTIQAAPTFSIFATREGLVGHTTANGHVIRSNDHFVALPSRRALNPNDGVRDYKVRVCNPRNGRCEDAPVFDVGPWNTRDDYWNPSNVRENWQNLPQGKPEATAAYYQNYNGGRDQFGRLVSNPAGIDLADGTWANLGMTNNDFVDVTYLWKG
ncbi:MAG TPA: hypothetical protein VFC19_36330 [Candidatus Limnocylindrales bacterium]|nr:hypothetical protein [Candidatus Limnocylindrales bacterium]